MKEIWITVYKDTIMKHDNDMNLSDIKVTEEFVRQYWKEKQAENFETFDDFLNEVTYEFTEDFYEYAKKHDAILDIQHWEL